MTKNQLNEVIAVLKQASADYKEQAELLREMLAKSSVSPDANHGNASSVSK